MSIPFENMLTRDWTTLDLFERQLSQGADRPFLRQGDRVLSYGQFWSKALGFAAHMTEVINGAPDQRVLIFLGNCAEARWTCLGAQAAGVLPILLNNLHRGKLLSDMVTAGKATILVTDARGLEHLPQDAVGAMTAVYITDDQNDQYTDLTSLPPAPHFSISHPKPTDPALLLFTSGTTGPSKAVIVPHNMVARGSIHIAQAFGFDQSDIHHLWMPPYHIAGQMHLFHAVVATGGQVALFPRFSLSNFWNEVREVSATRFGCFANAIKLLLAQPECEADKGNSLKTGLVGELSPSFKYAFEERFGTRLYDSFGMTECEPMTLTQHPENPPDYSCGKACVDFEIEIHDENGSPVPTGDVGEIVSRPKRAGMMMLGYDNSPEETVKRWRNLWWHTEDYGRMDEDGNLFFAGRFKDMIRHRGENISAVELEAMLLVHDDVVECAALGVPGELGDEDVKIFIKLSEGADFDPSDIRQFCEGSMARFMVPRFIECLSAFPYTFNGKIDKKALRALPPNHWDAGERSTSLNT